MDLAMQPVELQRFKRHPAALQGKQEKSSTHANMLQTVTRQEPIALSLERCVTFHGFVLATLFLLLPFFMI